MMPSRLYVNWRVLELLAAIVIPVSVWFVPRPWDLLLLMVSMTAFMAQLTWRVHRMNAIVFRLHDICAAVALASRPRAVTVGPEAVAIVDEIVANIRALPAGRRRVIEAE